MMNEKDKRVENVNKIIELISSKSRNFFEYKGTIASMIRKGNKIYMISEVHKKNMLITDNKQPYLWHHGSTLLDLIRQFKDYILTGKKYNGLSQSNNWGYFDNDLIEIENLCKELELLKK